MAVTPRRPRRTSVQYRSASVSERRTLPPAVAVSTVAFALRPPEDAVVDDAHRNPPSRATLWLPLVRRTRDPYLGRWALPGGPTEWNEGLADTALRTLHHAAARPPGYLEQLYAFGGVERSARAQRLVTIAYWALFGEHDLITAATAAPELEGSGDDGDAEASQRAPVLPSGGAVPTAAAGAHPRPAPSGWWDDPQSRVAAAPPPPAVEASNALHGVAAHVAAPDPNVAWFAIEHLPELAFDHAEIIAYAHERLRAKTEYAAVAHRLLGPVFTLTQLRAVHEAVRGEAVDPANFRRQALAQGSLVDTGERESGARHRPARLYRFRDAPPAEQTSNRRSKP